GKAYAFRFTGRGSPLPHQQIAGSMLHQLTLLLRRLGKHETHGRAPDRLADRLGVSDIIFVTLDISLHILRRHQAHLMAEIRQFACPIVWVAHASIPITALRRTTWLRRSCLLTATFSAASMPWTWNTCLARSNPIVVTCMWTAPHVIRLTTITLRHFSAGGRAPSTTS